MIRNAWDSYRNRRAVLVCLFVGYLPGAIVISFVFAANKKPEVLVIPFALAWIVAYVLAGHWIAYFPCPRCGMPFFYKRWMYAPWSKKCLHCSWSKWSEFDPMVDPTAKFGDNNDGTLECLQCGDVIPADSDNCVGCGWNYMQKEPSNNPMDRSGGSAAS